MDFLLRIWRGSPDPPRFRAIRHLYRIVRKQNFPEALGRRLLRRWLSTEQLAQFDARNFFDVIGCHTTKRYRIYYASVANVEELDKVGRPIMRYCFIPKGDLVPGDVMLAQKIALETNELAALAVANRFAPQPQHPTWRGHPQTSRSTARRGPSLCQGHAHVRMARSGRN
jgi:hypothetical protein